MTDCHTLTFARVRCVLQPLLVLALTLVVFPGVVRAQLTVSTGIEFFDWEEDTRPAVTEEGVLLAFGVGYTQTAKSGFLLGYRGKLWTGTVDYTGSTFFGNTPITGTTGYFGLTNEVQARLRKPLGSGNYRRDALVGLGLDVWRRELSSVQKEDYSVVYVRAGFEIDSLESKSWLLAFGAKYALWVREDAHLTSIGFDANPRLSPGAKISFFGKAGYRLTPEWNLVAYFDGHRFAESGSVSVNEVANGFGPATVYQPGSDLLVIGFKIERVFH